MALAAQIKEVVHDRMGPLAQTIISVDMRTTCTVTRSSSSCGRPHPLPHGRDAGERRRVPQLCDGMADAGGPRPHPRSRPTCPRAVAPELRPTRVARASLRLADSSRPAGQGGCDMAHSRDALRGRHGRCRAARRSFLGRWPRPPLAAPPSAAVFPPGRCARPTNRWPPALPRTRARAPTAAAAQWRRRVRGGHRCRSQPLAIWT